MKDISPAIAHRRCVAALTAIRVAVDEKVIRTDDMPEKLARKIKQIRRWQAEAYKQTLSARKLSAGAMRDLEKLFNCMCGGILGIWSKDDEEKWQTWASFLYAAENLIHDCYKCTCKEYAHGGAWYLVANAAEILAFALEDTDPEIGVRGTELYQKICDAA